LETESSLEEEFNISRMSDSQEAAFGNTIPGKKKVFRQPFYDILYNQHYRNMFEYNNHEIKYASLAKKYKMTKGRFPAHMK